MLDGTSGGTGNFVLDQRGWEKQEVILFQIKIFPRGQHIHSSGGVDGASIRTLELHKKPTGTDNVAGSRMRSDVSRGSGSRVMVGSALL